MVLNELLTAKVDLHCHCSNCSLPTSTILYAIWMQAAFTSALHSRYQPDRIRSLSPCLLEGISSPHFLLTSPSQVHQHKKATQAPRTLWSNVVSVCLAAQFFALQESLSHAQAAGSNSDPCDTIQSLLCLAF